MSDRSWKKLLQGLGKNVEDVGRMLERERAFTEEDLDDLQHALESSAETLTIIRKNALGKV